MQSLSCAYTDRARDWVREEARCIMRRFAVQLARARARTRIAGSWQSGACYVQRAENSCACFFPLSRVFCLSFSRRFRRAGSFRLLWPIVQKMDRGSAVSFSHLVAFIPPLHNVHLCRPAKRCHVPKQRQSTLLLRNVPCSLLFLSFFLFRTRPLATSLRLLFYLLIYLFFKQNIRRSRIYGTIAVT